MPENRFIEDITNYTNCKSEIYGEIEKQADANDRFQLISQREERNVYDEELIKKVSNGKYKTCWRGISMMKDCFDMIIYQQLLWELKPKTIFETGAYTGACALWMADTMKIYNLPVHVYSIDIDLSLVDERVSSDPNVTITNGNVLNIEEAFPKDLLKNCPHPWVISEDCHVDVIGVMEYFHKHMQKGDYFIIEDTCPDSPLVGGQGMLKGDYQKWGTSKLKLLKEFLYKHKEYYAVDSYYTDFFGYNGTYNWNGYIKRIK